MVKRNLLFQIQELFGRNKGRKKLIELLNSNGIIGEEAERMATQAYRMADEKINREIEIQERKSLGGPIGKMIIGVFALSITLFGWLAFGRVLYLAFFGGLFLITIGVKDMVKGSEKEFV